MTTDIKDKVLELVVFALNDGVTRDELLQSVDPVSEWVAEQPGFISRQLTETDGGKWVEIVWWESLAEAETAAEAALSSERCSPMFSMIRLDDMVALHGVPVIEFASV